MSKAGPAKPKKTARPAAGKLRGTRPAVAAKKNSGKKRFAPQLAMAAVVQAPVIPAGAVVALSPNALAITKFVIAVNPFGGNFSIQIWLADNSNKVLPVDVTSFPSIAAILTGGQAFFDNGFVVLPH
jgi:hypothetical protein